MAIDSSSFVVICHHSSIFCFSIKALGCIGESLSRLPGAVRRRTDAGPFGQALFTYETANKGLLS
jgi:hypothetical protein